MKPSNNRIFVNFRDVIKSPDIAILESLKDPELKKQFSEIVDYTRFEYMDQANLIRVLIQRTDKNILRYLGLKKNYEYDKLYKMLYDNIDSKYIEYPPFSIVETLSLVLTSVAISSIYIYTENYEPEVQTQLGLIFNANSNKVKYIYGDLKTCIVNKDIDLFIINDVDMILKLAEIQELRYKEILLANYGYNFELKGDELVLKYDLTDTFISSIFKLNMFDPYNLTEVNMTQIDNNVIQNNNLSLG